MIKGDLIYEGKVKTVYETDNPKELLIHFKDEIISGENPAINSRGNINNKLSAFFFKQFENRGIKTHFIEVVSKCEMLVKRLSMIKLEIIVRNIVTKNLTDRLGLPEGNFLDIPVIEYNYKNETLNTPMLNRWHILVLNLATIDEINEMEHISLSVNTILRQLLKAQNIDLIDFKLEFGRTEKGEILLADEMSLDTCHFKGIKINPNNDNDPENVKAYQEIFERLVM